MANGKRPTGVAKSHLLISLSLGNNLGTAEVSSSCPASFARSLQAQARLQHRTRTVLSHQREASTLPPPVLGNFANLPKCSTVHGAIVSLNRYRNYRPYRQPPPQPPYSGFFRKSRPRSSSIAIVFSFHHFPIKLLYLPSKSLDALIKLASRAILNKAALLLFDISIRLSRGLPNDRESQWD